MARIGARFQDKLDRRVFEASLRRMQAAPNDPTALAAQRDLESIQRLWASPVLLAVFDIPWTPIFVAAIFVFHQWMGWLAICGGIILVAITILNQRLTKIPMNRANNVTLQAERLADNLKAEAEIVQSLGMAGTSFDRWQQARGMALSESISAADLGGSFSTLSKTFRLVPAIGDAWPWCLSCFATTT